MNKQEQELFNLLSSLSKKLPSFSDGRIDYSHASMAPVITIFVNYKKKILLLKRSQKVQSYKGQWNTVAGYLDELRPLQEKILEELKEEINISASEIASCQIGTSYSFTDKTKKMTWIVYPALVTLNHQPTITLDWEHTEYAWIHPQDISAYDTVPNAEKSLKSILSYLNK